MTVIIANEIKTAWGHAMVSNPLQHSASDIMRSQSTDQTEYFSLFNLHYYHTARGSG